MNRQIGAYLKYSLLFAMLLAGGAISRAAAQVTSFTYQGRLQDGGVSANGNYDLQFTLWDSLSGGTQQPQPSPLTVTRNSVAVANGAFTVQLDFGASAFPGADRFLEMGVRLAGGGPFTVLAPRQPITSTPYAVRSLSASTVDSIPVGALPGGSGNYIQNTTSLQATSNFNISGNGTAGGTLQANILRATTQYRIGNFSDPVLSAPANNNLFVGIRAGIANTAGGNNTFVGNDAGRSNASGINNSFFGVGAGVNNTTGGANSIFGFDAGGGNLGGASNSFFGYFAGSNNTSGNQNNFFGQSAGANTTTGTGNSFFGNTSGLSNTVESLNSLLGSFADTAPGITNATAIGARAKVAQSNSLVLGSIAGVNNGSNTNVGIGTTTPTSRLHVVGDTNLEGNLTVSGNLNATLPAGSGNYIQNTTSPQGSSNFNISGNGVIGASLIANGSIAIGTTTPTGRFLVAQSTAGTGSVSIVSGSTTVSGTNTQFTTFFHVGDTIAVAGTAPRTISAISSNTSLVVSSSFSTTANGLSYTLFNGTSLAVSVDGKVGIGTASPSYKFHVLQQNDSTAAGNFQSNSPTGFSNGLLVTAGTNANDVSFWSRDQAGNTIFMARGDGAVGIGTGAPGSALEVRRNATVASAWQTGQLRISGATDPNMQLNMGYDTSSNVGVIQTGQVNFGYTNLSLNPFGGNVTVGPIDSISGISKLYAIAGSDKYGIVGSATNLDGVSGISTAGDGVFGRSSTGAGVYGTSSTFGVVGIGDSDSQNFGFTYVGKAAVWGTSQSSVAVFGTSDTNVGVVGVSQSNIGVLGRSISGTAGYFDGTVVVATLANGGGFPVCRNSSNQLSSCSSSSLRYKKDISRFGSGLDVINRLKPIAFTWKSDGTRDFGLGAEDVEKVDPSLVFYRDGKIEGVKYDRIGVVLINAVKEQEVQIAQQKKALEHQQELIKQQTEQFRQQSAMVTAQLQQIEALKKLVCRSHRNAKVCR